MPNNTPFKPIGKTRVHLKEEPGQIWDNQILYYDPTSESEFSRYIETHLPEIKELFKSRKFDFCYFPELSNNITKEQILYRYPNWKGEPLQRVGNDLLRQYIADEDKDVGACLFRSLVREDLVFSCFQLQPLSQVDWGVQLSYYLDAVTKEREAEDDGIRYSISEPQTLFTAFEKKYCPADDRFDWTSIDIEIADAISQLRKEGVEEFVLRCMVPIKGKLSKIIITPKFEIVLPDFGNMPIEISPLPKALFLLFLKHEEGIYFKDLIDYKDELKEIYAHITNRIQSMIISGSIEKIVDPTQNAINEKCSRIKEAFLARMDSEIASNYYITGKRGERKRIPLPRNLVEWQCKL
jgi:hypothetical protein